MGVVGMGLFKKAWESENEYKALEAVRKEKNQKKLEIIAVNAQFASVRKAAVAKLPQRSSVLLSIAERDEDVNVRLEVFKKIADDAKLDISTLKSLIIKEENPNVCLAAVNCMIYMSEHTWGGKEAIKEANYFLFDIFDKKPILADADRHNCLIMLEKLPEIAKRHMAWHEKNIFYRRMAVTYLNDIKALMELVDTNDDPDTHAAAEQRLLILGDTSILKEIIINNKDKKFCSKALSKLIVERKNESKELALLALFLIEVAKTKPEIIKSHWRIINRFLCNLHVDSGKHTDKGGNKSYVRYNDCHGDTYSVYEGPHSDYGVKPHTDNRNAGRQYLDRFPAYVKES
jgi:hypothetical protein